MESNLNTYLNTYPLHCALTIASSDSGAGAGIQADLKTFSALGVYGLTAIAGITAQNTQTVNAAFYLPPALLTAQLEAVFADFEIKAIKIGLLGTASNTEAVGDFLKTRPRIPIIVDPVMVSASGHVFLDDSAIQALTKLFEIADLITPNLPEATHISGSQINTEEDYFKAAEKILDLGPRAVLIKGGHSKGTTSSDLLCIKGEKPQLFPAQKLASTNDHGTGCSLSSAIAAFLARGETLINATEKAKKYVYEAISQGLPLGKGHGPIHHFYKFYGFSVSKNPS
ncbi:MAG: bifunctional hydroxymethylpyrimidine kinase/phosphomethylpyrimidine kinase [Deltaproteobacteria bacterium]|nr:bifunctional hydroxymethylpyrimidine kinase/phosphomethylpyrimidine kinase [Deltaproteobacteria bacterium]